MSNARIAATVWRQALAHYDEVARMDADALPRSTVQTAYYAVFHAARAFIIARSGEMPRTHAGVHNRFGALVRGTDDPSLQDANRTLARLQQFRQHVAYESDWEEPPGGPAGTVVDARRVLTALAIHLGLPPPP